MKDLIALGAALLGVPFFMGLGAVVLWAINSLLVGMRLPGYRFQLLTISWQA